MSAGVRVVDVDDLASACDECSKGGPGSPCASGCACLPCRVGTVPSVDDDPGALAGQLAVTAMEFATLVQRLRVMQKRMTQLRQGVSPELARIFGTLDQLKTIKGDRLT